MNKVVYTRLIGLLMVALLAACGDSVTETTTVYHNDDIAVLAAGDSLKNQTCDSSSIGELLYVTDSTELFLCNGKKWTSLKGERGKTGKTGKDGKKGDDGPKGDDGESLPGDKGLQGPKGDDGVDGASCKIVSDKDGVVVIKCGDGEDADSVKMYKSICGSTPFDPEKATCVNGETFSCGGKPYNPLKEECIDGKTYSCNGKPFNPAKQLCDDRDGQMYDFVKVGDDVWMAENLNYNYNVGSAKSMCYDDEPKNCEKYGRLYTWSAAMDSAAKFSNDCKNCGFYSSAESSVKAGSDPMRGVCPEGWHMPSVGEWQDVVSASGKASGSAAPYFKSTTDWLVNEDVDGNGADEMGMNILPAGEFVTNKLRTEYQSLHEKTYFWTSLEMSDQGVSTVAFTAWLSYADTEFYVGSFLDNRHAKDQAISVRCVKNN